MLALSLLLACTSAPVDTGAVEVPGPSWSACRARTGPCACSLVPEEVDGVELDVPAIEAAVLEAVDRVYTGDRSEDLEAVLHEPGAGS